MQQSAYKAYKAFKTPGAVEAGVDEAGRGCLAGPVCAACVVWNPDCTGEIDDAAKLGIAIRDSKKLTHARRMQARDFIHDHAIAHGVAFVDVDVIDRDNILKATIAAMHAALDQLDMDLDEILVDGDRFAPYMTPSSGNFVPHTCVVDGDDSYLSIAAASILAKTERDLYMVDTLHPMYPCYGWDVNKGYGTAAHMKALGEHGVSPHHRKSFAPCTLSNS